MSETFPYLLAMAISFALVLVLTPLVRALARRWRVVARPKSDRWHTRPTAMLGGVAIWLSVMVSYLFFVPHTPRGWVVVGASTFLFLVGLIDDLIPAKPYQKLVGQVMGSAFVVYYGVNLQWTRISWIDMLITIFWLIGITNAINLLDNMDGLAAGIAAIAASCLTFALIVAGQPTEALLVGVFAAALVGFLVYNSNPASLFMGDCGSMFIGCFVASSV